MRKYFYLSLLLVALSLSLVGCGSDNSVGGSSTGSIVGTWKFISIIMTDYEANTSYGSENRNVEFTSEDFSREENSLIILNDNINLVLDFEHNNLSFPASNGYPIYWGTFGKRKLVGPYVLTGSTLSVVDDVFELAVTLTAKLNGNRLTLESTYNISSQVKTRTAADKFKKTVWERL